MAGSNAKDLFTTSLNVLPSAHSPTLYRQFHEEGDREGMKDPEVLGLAASLSRILVTHNVRAQGATSSPSFLRGVETNAFAHEPFEAAASTEML